MPSPLVSIVILNCNGREDTEACVRSILADATMPAHEIIVLDNGSIDDESLSLKQTFGTAIHVLRSNHNLGVAGGCNEGARHARGTYLVLLNNDTEVTSGWLMPLLSVMDTDAEIGACQPKIRSLIHRDSFDYCGACGGFLDRNGYPFMRGRIFDTVEQDHGQYDTPLDIDWASGACLLIRRSLWEELGGLDEGYFAYMEEIDLCWRLKKRGYRIRSIPSSLIYHRGGTTWRRQQLRKRFYEHRNNLLLLLKNLDRSSLLPVMLRRLPLEGASFAFYIVRGKWKYAVAQVAGFCAFLWHIPSWSTKRSIRSDIGIPLHQRPFVVGEYFLRGHRQFSALPTAHSFNDPISRAA